MTTALLAFAFMLLLISAMAVGVLFGRPPITGSCGGMKALGLDMECEVCGGDPQRCDSAGQTIHAASDLDLAASDLDLIVDAAKPQRNR